MGRVRSDRSKVALRTRRSTSKPDNPMHPRAAEIIARLGLGPHPERGFFAETYRAEASVSAATHPGARSASTAIYFLVTSDAPATFPHRLISDEVFHLYEG